MRKCYLIIAAIAFVILSGCDNKKAIVDGITQYELPLMERQESNQITHLINHDGMYRSEQYAANSTLVIDLDYYKSQKISRGDVVYFKTDAKEEEISNKKRKGYDVARVVALPGETLLVKKGQIYINGRVLDTFYGKEYYTNGFINGTDKALSMDKETVLLDGQYLLASDVWWRGGFTEPLPKDKITGRVIGWIKSQNE
ncbi:S26 family signal peptidase [Paenibacillus hodogayensis]|uniref:S26 family signal peptidase n=1 Tax=Paenibacillus hodogayensis TaxID=279208 RepID=A0ABV5W7V1_9BACL